MIPQRTGLAFFLTGWMILMNASLTFADAQETKRWEVIVCNPLLQGLEMESTWAAAQAAGVKGIEINVYSDLSCSSLVVGKDRPFRMDTPENAKKMSAEAKAHGLLTPVICAPVQLDTISENATAPDWAKTLLQNAPYAGAKLVYFPIVTGPTKSDLEDNVFIERTTALLKNLSSCSKESGVAVAFENLSIYWNRPEIARPVLNAFQSGQVGLCLDPINFYWFGHPRSKVYEIVKEFIPRALHFHVKNVRHPEDQREAHRMPGWDYGKNSVPAAEGDLDFKKILGWLHESGYQGYISIEDDSLGHYPVEKRLEILRQDVEYLRAIIRDLNP